MTIARNAVPASRKRRASNTQFAERHNEIIDLAAHLFATNGYAATGIREIGDAADLARGALYYYIESKEALLEEIHNRVIDPLIEQAASIESLDIRPSARIRLISEVLLRSIIERRDHVWVFLHEHRSLTGDRKTTFRAKRNKFERIVSGLLQAGVEAGEFEINDVGMALLAFLGMHHYTYQWLPRNLDWDPVALSELYCNIFFNGVAKRQNA